MFDSRGIRGNKFRMRIPKAFLLASSIALAALPARSQEAAGPEFLKNANFEHYYEKDNLWNGVNPEGVLAGGTALRDEKSGPPILTAEGGIDNRPMPVSVSLGDLNADGLTDIAAMENPGYLRVYFNSGTPQEPKFEKGELAPFFISRISDSDPTLSWISNPSKNKDFWYARQSNRIHLSELAKSGKKDLVIGNYLGEVFLIPNSGTTARAEFRTPGDLAKAMIPTSKGDARRWGNLFSPVTMDWDGDGKDDLLLGEGSYSANSIHLLLNQGAANAPKFDETATHFLAYGMGLEQLTPCLVDYNGDGKTDLLVTESGGKVAIYLNKAETWKPGDTLSMDSFLKVGGNDLSLGGISTISPGDLNGDGLFDLVFGKNNGRLAMAVNSGSKESPKFDSVQDLKASAGVPRLKLPHNWNLDSGYERGNFYATIAQVSAQEDPTAEPPEGNSCLRIAYATSPNTVMAAPDAKAFAASEKGFRPQDIDIFWQDEMQNLGLHGTNGIVARAGANFFVIRQGGSSPLVPGKTYTLSMKAKGQNVVFSSAYIGAVARIEGEDLASQKAGTRGGVQRRLGTTGRDRTVFKEIKLGAQQNWTDFSTELPVRFGDKRIMDAKDNPSLKIDWAVYIVAELAPMTGKLYIDDIKITEKK
jgi:hypothetical protein